MITADFPAILERLAGNQVDFIVIGGVAASLHGSAYVTQDLDICYERSEAGIERVCRALVDLHPTLRGAPEGLPFRFDPATVGAGLNFTLSTDLGPLDLLCEVVPFGNFASQAPRDRDGTRRPQGSRSFAPRADPVEAGGGTPQGPPRDTRA